VVTLGLEGEVDHHNAVLFYDANEQNDSDDADDVEVEVEEAKGEEGADAGRWQRGEDGKGVDEALVEHPEHDVDSDQRGEDEESLV
jgi:hypothetical protein